ncbi:hypothetical protein CK203_042598 [Vitis vinifera]|uniref:Disease resistance protein n=1 Tax=Vitis vinifera TaxID=29760 RepID=A0A438I7U7_VITVI|nr:hypothetical protein CK203_042598 [Vitis vinifera]
MRWSPSGWGLDTLTSLGELFIQGPFRDLLSFSGSHLLLPTSLTTLRLGNLRNLKSIASTSLQSLISLKTLEFHICPKFRSFMPNEGLPATLAKLVIRECPVLKGRCLKDKGKDWPKIAHIPYVQIDGIDDRPSYLSLITGYLALPSSKIEVRINALNCKIAGKGIDVEMKVKFPAICICKGKYKIPTKGWAAWSTCRTNPQQWTLNLYPFYWELVCQVVQDAQKGNISQAIIHFGQVSLAISQSDHLSLWPSLISAISPCSQSQGRKRFSVGRLVVRKHSPPVTFPANFSDDVFFPHRKERLEEITNFSQSTGARKPPTRRPRAFFWSTTVSHASAHEDV